MRAPVVTYRNLRSHDGTVIAYQVCGDGPAVVLANGFCTPYHTYRYLYRLFERGYRVISWDYRGLFRSEPPPDGRSYGFEHQVQDLDRVLNAEGVERALFIGEGRNRYRLPDYHRLDLGIKYEVKLWRTLKTSFEISFYNVYNRRNVNSITYCTNTSSGKGGTGPCSQYDPNKPLFNPYGISYYGFRPSATLTVEY